MHDGSRPLAMVTGASSGIGLAISQELVDHGFDLVVALMKGKDHVVAGSPKNRAQVAAAKVLAEKVTAAMHGATSKPGSGRS